MEKITLTIGIPTLNEEKNIASLLQEILKQKQSNFVIQDIIVYSDASTDKTDTIVTAFSEKDTRIKLIRGTERKGKYSRVNELFTLCTSDALVILDADIGLQGDHFLENLLTVLLSDKKAQLVAAHQVQLRPKTFMGKIIYTHFLVWDYVRWSIPNYHSARNYYGSATAYRGSFARSIHIPTGITDPHLYIYLQADIKNGFRYCEKAVMVQWPIATIRDYNKFLRRSIGKRDTELIKIFGEDYINKARFVAKRYKYIGLCKAFLHEPIFTPLSCLLNIYMKIHSLMKHDVSTKWDIVSSTKKAIEK